jgi:1-acyl-sn-glycerol-3-phosphate acyltransferase
MKRNSNAAGMAAPARPSILARTWSAVATLLSVLYTLLLLGPAAIASLFDHGHLCTFIFRLWSWLILHSCGVTVEIEGIEHLAGVESFVLVSNHQSLFDILLVLSLIPREVRFLAKREIKQVPILGFTLEHSGNIVIDRASGGKTIRRALAAVRHGYSICVFAEGHRYSDNRVHEFNEGAAWLAIATKLSCVPMAIGGTAELMPRGTRLVRPGRQVRIVLRAPVPTAGLKSADRMQLTKRLEEEVRTAFRSASGVCSPV